MQRKAFKNICKNKARTHLDQLFEKLGIVEINDNCTWRLTNMFPVNFKSSSIHLNNTLGADNLNSLFFSQSALRLTALSMLHLVYGMVCMFFAFLS